MLRNLVHMVISEELLSLFIFKRISIYYKVKKVLILFKQWLLNGHLLQMKKNRSIFKNVLKLMSM